MKPSHTRISCFTHTAGSFTPLESCLLAHLAILVCLRVIRSYTVIVSDVVIMLMCIEMNNRSQSSIIHAHMLFSHTKSSTKPFQVNQWRTNLCSQYFSFFYGIWHRIIRFCCLSLSLNSVESKRN